MSSGLLTAAPGDCDAAMADTLHLASASEAPPPASAPRALSAKLEQARRFDAFVKRYRKPLLQYFRRRAIGAGDVEDLVQTVFLRLIHKLRADDAALSDAYVFTAASSVLVDHHRRGAVKISKGGVEIDLHLAANEPDAQQILEDRQTLRVMLDSLSKMGTKCRRAFMLHRFDSLSYVEIAQKMGVSASSIEKYVMSALAELRDSTDRGRHD